MSLLGTIALAATVAVPASASTVRADYEATGTRVGLAEGADETNRLRVRVPDDAREIRFRDAASPIDPVGKRCERVRGRGFRADCELAGEFFFEVEVDAGAGDDSIKSAVAQRYRTFGAAVVFLYGGPGDDAIAAGEAEDTIDPGTGTDEVHSGGGYDFIAAGASDDGPDSYDGGRQGATVSYAEREAPVSVRLDGQANDGAVGEGDDVARTFGATGGTAGDALHGDRHPNYLFGGGGADRLRGRGNEDAIVGEAGSDRIFAGPGDDWVLDRGTGGVDVIDCGPGQDLYEADARDKTRRCEIPLFGPRAERTKSLVNAKR